MSITQLSRRTLFRSRPCSLNSFSYSSLGRKPSRAGRKLPGLILLFFFRPDIEKIQFAGRPFYMRAA